MDFSSEHPLLQVTQEEIFLVQNSYDLDAKKINDNINTVEEWCKKQDHLVEALPYLNRNILERFLILGRGSIERTKTAINQVLTIKATLPDFFPTDLSILKDLDRFLDNVLVVPLPKVNKDTTRIILCRVMSENWEMETFLSFSRFICFILQTRMFHDYVFSDRVILDFKHVKANILKKLNLVTLKKIEVVFTEAFKVKVKGFHIINAQPFVNTLISLSKQVIKEKITNRIYVHSSYEDLYREIPKEFLPKEYGGEQMCCAAFVELWKNYFKSEDARGLLQISSKLVSNESKRTNFRFNEEYLGLPGSFKQINVD